MARLPVRTSAHARPGPRVRVLVPIAIALAVIGSLLSTSVHDAAADGRRQSSPVSYVPPVDAPVIDPFRPPPNPYAAGNRGLEYGTAPGDPVRASADGIVIFAGQVGGTLHITIRHADGLRTSYSFLATIT